MDNEVQNELQESGAKRTLIVAIWIIIIAMIIIAIAVVVWRGQNEVVTEGDEVSLEDIGNDELRALEGLRRAHEESGAPTLTEEEQLQALEELRKAHEESGAPTLTEEEQLQALEELRKAHEENND